MDGVSRKLLELKSVITNDNEYLWRCLLYDSKLWKQIHTLEEQLKQVEVLLGDFAHLAQKLGGIVNIPPNCIFLKVVDIGKKSGNWTEAEVTLRKFV